MSDYKNLSKQELLSLKQSLTASYERYAGLGLSLDMSRGKPGPVQLDTTNGLLDAISSQSDTRTISGFDTRNYGLPDGIPECKQLFADLMQVSADNLFVCGNSSLTIMFDYISQCMTHGAGGGEPWLKQGNVKFVCPVPGYDRHFRVLEYFGIEMISIAMNEDGPDMDALEKLVTDSSVKGLICVPKYSNPTGYTFSDETVRRFAALKPAAKDFRIIWDNAYLWHDIGDGHDELLNIFDVCAEYGSEDMVIEVASSSKISFPGAGVAVLAASKNNIAEIKKRITTQTIGFDKINQLRHVRFFKDKQGVLEHMRLQSEHLAPRFRVVLDKFDSEFSGKGIARWTRPNGGYFVSLDVLDGCAARTIDLCVKAGVTLTPAGAAFPYGKDPHDSNIRIAPSYPSLDDLATAMQVLCVSAELVAVEKILENK